MKKRLYVMTIIATMVASSFVGCGVRATGDKNSTASESQGTNADGTVKKATEGSITVYTALEDDIIEMYLQSFYEKYPDIDVNIVRDATGTIVAKAIAERENSVADVIWGTSATVLLQLDDYNMIQPYTPEGADRIDDRFKDSDEDGDGLLKWTGIDVSETAFLVNNEECKAAGVETPTSMADLVDPKYKGLIVMPDPTSSGTGMLTVNGILQSMGDEEGWDYLTKLNDNVAQYTTSGSKPAKMAAGGECAIGISMGYRCAALYQEYGDEVSVVFPSEGSGWDVEANCLIAKDNINPCAYTFLDWAISDEAMQAYSKEYPITGIGVISELPDGYSKDPMANLIDMDLVKAAKDRDSVIDKFTPFLAGKAEE